VAVAGRKQRHVGGVCGDIAALRRQCILSWRVCCGAVTVKYTVAAAFHWLFTGLSRHSKLSDCFALDLLSQQVLSDPSRRTSSRATLLQLGTQKRGP
jgi:hypothetical protein